MIDFLSFTAVVALCAAWLLLLLKKVGVVEWLQVHGSDIIARLAMCNFCLSWWTCVIVSVVGMCITCDARMILVPFVATPLTRILL